MTQYAIMHNNKGNEIKWWNLMLKDTLIISYNTRCMDNCRVNFYEWNRYQTCKVLVYVNRKI